ncbi:exosortase-associated EpsI family protein [Aquisphaera insulae]|uniref:exosortase-associated EpsI family protein n=1 Tax=Aquisphaera insulae TaxID=2712864 RepID=UPI0013EB3D59|nr:exosortase-associated EpsI family protein [Aquisphaera insulae]
MATVELPQKVQDVPKAAVHFEWKRLALVCALIAVSGGIRYWRDWQFAALSKGSEASPFPLIELPLSFDTWQAQPGSEQVLEPEIARVAGASDHVIRTYTDSKTGLTADVMVLYGLAVSVWGHVPEVCYPAGGMEIRSHADRVTVPAALAPGQTATFQRQLFGRSTETREVYHSFKNSGKWDVDMEENWKAFRYHPSMFKIQVQHPYGGDAASKETERLLGLIVDEIERRGAAKK